MAKVSKTTITVYQVTGPCWRIKQEANGRIINIRYSEKKVTSPYKITIVDHLTQLFSRWKRDVLDFPNKDAQIRLDFSINKFNLVQQVEDLNLNWIENNFDNLPRLCRVLGIIRLTRRLFVAGKISWPNVKNTFIYFLQEKKSKRSDIDTELDWLETNGHISLTQKNNYIADLDAL